MLNTKRLFKNNESLASSNPPLRWKTSAAWCWLLASVSIFTGLAYRGFLAHASPIVDFQQDLLAKVERARQDKAPPQPVSVSNISDIVYMIKLPRQQKEYPWQQVTIQQRQTPDSQLWQPTRNADILVLGDSFSNIYSYGGAWGQAAVFAEQLAYYPQRPVDRIAIDGGAANETRLELRRSILQGRDRLLGNRLVIYEFSVRYLLHDDWKPIDLPLTKMA
ncbi:MAG: hypothetical protein JO316_04175 [Abitibacteriaceae bacterium]|nr:hypothetical protein [Abditibacteriaceae bacterium]